MASFRVHGWDGLLDHRAVCQSRGRTSHGYPRASASGVAFHHVSPRPALRYGAFIVHHLRVLVYDGQECSGERSSRLYLPRHSRLRPCNGSHRVIRAVPDRCDLPRRQYVHYRLGWGSIRDQLLACPRKLRLIDDMQTRVVFETRKCRVDVDDAFLNIMSTIAVILIRNAIRKYQSLTPKPQASEDTRTKSVATCITYHCRIELREATHNTIGPYIAKPTPSSARMVQLRFVPVDTVFDATNVLIPRWFAMVSTNSWRQNTQIWLRVAGAVGLVSTIVGILLPPSLHSTIASILALVATTLFVGVYSAHFQRQLLIRLIHSFDYAFLSAHFSLLHIGACDLVYWDSRVLTIMASWLWIHWLITLDAVTPVMKHKLGYCKHMAILIALMYFFEQICLGVELVFLDYRHLQDRVLFTIQLEDHAKPVRVIPLVLGRLVTTVLWTSRILWRILDRRGSELVMLLGHVEYDDVELVCRRKRNNESSHDSTSVSHSRNLRLKLMVLRALMGARRHLGDKRTPELGPSQPETTHLPRDPHKTDSM